MEPNTFMSSGPRRAMADAVIQEGYVIEEEKKRQAEQLALQQQQEAAAKAQLEQKTNPNNSIGGVLQEAGTAVLGGGIDAVEGIGATAEMALTGQANNVNFKPTWLQVSDEQEPMNRTAWGKVLRGVSEYAALTLALRGAGKAAATAKVPGLAKAGAYLSKNPSTLGGRVVQGAVTGAAVDFTSSFAQGDTLTTELNKMMPWIPDALVTNDSDTPIERRLKNVVEGIGLGVIGDVAFGHFAAKRAAKAAGKGAKAADPAEVAEVVAKNHEASRARVEKELIQRDIELDPQGLKGPTPHVNPDVFDRTSRAVIGVGNGQEASLYKNLLDAYRIATDPTQGAGRRLSVATEAAIDQRLSQFDPERKKILKSIQDKLDSTDSLKTEINGVQVTGEQLRKLSAARYIDIVDATGNPDELERLGQLLYEGANTRIDQSTGLPFLTLSTENHRAAEMLIHTTAGELADIASGTLSVMDEVVTDTQRDMLTKRLEFLLMETGKSKYYRGLDLQSIKNNGILPVNQKAVAEVVRNTEAQVKEFTAGLNEVFKQDPQMAKAFTEAFAVSGGDVKSLDALYDYAKDKIFNVKSLIGSDGKKSAFVDGLMTNMYNSVLSAPKTISRALLGTSLVTFMRPIQVAVGGILSGDTQTMKLGLAQAHSVFEGMGEAWQLARKTHDAMIHGLDDIPYRGETIIPVTETADWKSLGAVIENSGDQGAQFMYNMTSAIHDFNNLRIVKYPMVAMASVDSFAKTLIGRMELKAEAMAEAVAKHGDDVSPKMVRAYEDKLRDAVFNSKGEAINKFSEYAGQEAALTLPLTGNLAKLDAVIQNAPIAKPFFMFMKTGINSLQLVSQHAPILSRFSADVRDVMRATVDNLEPVARMGITTPEKLIEAKALMKGRVATGYLTVGTAVGLYFGGNLTGNGPMDKETRNAWMQAGWRPRSIKVGGRWVNYDGLEPFASFLALTADIGDNSSNLGSAATEDWFQKLSYMIAMNATNKTFLSGLTPFADMIGGNALNQMTTLGNVVNNQVPWGGLRNELANLINPGMREVEKDFWDTVKNRNPVLRGTLSKKFDVLDGSVIREYDFPTRMLNSISPIQLNTVDTVTRKQLRDSGFDISFTMSTDSRGNKLSAPQRSAMQNLVGKQNIEKQLTELFAHPDIKKELTFYREMRAKGIPDHAQSEVSLPIKQSLVYNEIERIFSQAKRNAEVELYQKYPELRSTADTKDVVTNAQRGGNTEAVRQFLANPNK